MSSPPDRYRKLASMTPLELTRRAEQMRIPDDVLEAADQSPNRKAALMQLIVGHQEESRLREELSGASPRVLARRAEDMGIADGEVDAADLAGDARPRLLLRHPARPRRVR